MVHWSSNMEDLIEDFIEACTYALHAFEVEKGKGSKRELVEVEASILLNRVLIKAKKQIKKNKLKGMKERVVKTGFY